jgi:hypothetical protein
MWMSGHVMEEYQFQLIKFTVISPVSYGDSHNVKWVVDSGATRHMSKESQVMFQNYKYSEVGVSLGDSSKLLSEGVGSVGRVSNVF